MDIPEFTADDLNELAKRARKSDYYYKAYSLVLDTLDLSPVKEANLSEK
jgi:hypothetical protein